MSVRLRPWPTSPDWVQSFLPFLGGEHRDSTDVDQSCGGDGLRGGQPSIPVRFRHGGSCGVARSINKQEANRRDEGEHHGFRRRGLRLLRQQFPNQLTKVSPRLVDVEGWTIRRGGEHASRGSEDPHHGEVGVSDRQSFGVRMFVPQRVQERFLKRLHPKQDAGWVVRKRCRTAHLFGPTRAE